jgi:hypothetical protein
MQIFARSNAGNDGAVECTSFQQMLRFISLCEDLLPSSASGRTSHRRDETLWQLRDLWQPDPSMGGAYSAFATFTKKHMAGVSGHRALTMLVTYHKPYDAKFLLLTVPAGILLWIEGGRIGRIAVLVNTLAIVLSSDIQLGILVFITRKFRSNTENLSG